MLDGSPFNADGGSNLDAELQGIAIRASRVLFLWLDRLLLTCFLLAAAAPYLDPRYYWYGAAMAVALPLLAGMMLPCALLLWRLRRPTLALVHLLLVIALVPRHFSLERFDRPQAKPSDLVLMSLNAPRRPESDVLAEKLAQLVRDVQPDMIGLQEALIFAYKTNPERLRAQQKFKPLIESLNYSMHPPRLGPLGENYNSWHQPMLARFEIDRQDQLSFHEDGENSQSLHVLRSEFSWQGRKIAHYNVHLTTHGRNKPWNGVGRDLGAWLTRIGEVRRAYRKRAWQVEQIVALIDKEVHPVILSGDFNSTPDSWVYRRLSAGLQDAYRVAGDGWGATYRSSFPILRIDWVLLDPEFEVVSAVVHPLDASVSDHRPLVVRLRWRE